jgi:hypothetical protein
MVELYVLREHFCPRILGEGRKLLFQSKLSTYMCLMVSTYELFRIAVPQPLAVKFGITSYLCPNLWENPWCPASPGMAGYMFVGLGEEIHKFVQPEVHELFVGVAKANYRLMGRYRAHRVEPLTVEEWLTLPEKVSILGLEDIRVIS